MWFTSSCLLLHLVAIAPLAFQHLRQNVPSHLRTFIYVIFSPWEVLYIHFCLVSIYLPVRSQLNCEVLRKGLPKEFEFTFFVIVSL